MTVKELQSYLYRWDPTMRIYIKDSEGKFLDFVAQWNFKKDADTQIEYEFIRLDVLE